MKNIIITGTSRGIGYELVKQFAAEGHNVLALSRNEKPILDLNLANVSCFSCDLTNPEDYQKIQEVLKKWDQVDILINNAGSLLNKPFLETTTEEFEAVYKVNVFAVAELTRIVVPKMAVGAHVVTISSMGGVQGSMKFAGLAAYSSSKGAVITLTELWAEEFKEKGPSFNVLAIGAVQTEMLAEAFPGYEAPLQPNEMANYIKDFSLTGHKFYNGKLLQVSSTTP
ncbi:short-chain dehydrogenase [Croceivirga lutea]|uniref:SDR family NAD(P)-dependent oxidoreductase n=1 Tax=Croceivirga lutea TaxID=1775167 RepID=UPI00163B23C3|nr:SDR family oxidoreductase [Croceivirga lutea]GGG56102.1 short-chain dehydrogenase [Croceivirga lutea]